MNVCLTSAQLKALSKGQLLGNYGSAVSAELSVDALILLSSLLCTALSDMSTVTGIVIAHLIAFILDLLTGILELGLTRFFLNLSCAQPLKISDVFSGFRTAPDKALAVRFLLQLMQLLCLLPAVASFIFYTMSPSSVVFLVFSMMTVIGTILWVFLSLMYSQVYYVILDFPDYSVKQIFSFSRSIMSGHKGRLFYIHISLLPYYLTGLLTCGLGFLWINPFRHAVTANFYLDLMNFQS